MAAYSSASFLRALLEPLPLIFVGQCLPRRLQIPEGGVQIVFTAVFLIPGTGTQQPCVLFAHHRETAFCSWDKQHSSSSAPAGTPGLGPSTSWWKWGSNQIKKLLGLWFSNVLQCFIYLLIYFCHFNLKDQRERQRQKSCFRCLTPQMPATVRTGPD